MKHDPYFKYLAAVILVGVVLAFVTVTTRSAAADPLREATGQP